jgi:hypothetical protein
MKAAAIAVASIHFFDIEDSCYVAAADAPAGAARAPLFFAIHSSRKGHGQLNSEKLLYTNVNSNCIEYRLK